MSPPFYYFTGPSISLPDPSEIYRPAAPCFELDRDIASYRNYDNLDEDQARVRDTYYTMHRNQTHAYATSQRAKYKPGIVGQYTVMEMLDIVGTIVDESDPDTSLTNDVHMYQTAERIRERHPDKPWFALVGLLHDLGKIMVKQGEPQWAVVGDIFVTGCEVAPNVVFGKESFAGNPDLTDPRYSTPTGVYTPNCGLSNVVTSWGHDEYMYQVLKRNNVQIPDEGMYMIRFHSLYPWHHHGNYDHLCSDKDRQMLPWVQTFSSFDLYSKSEKVPHIPDIKPFYESLIAQYCPGKLSW